MRTYINVDADAKEIRKAAKALRRLGLDDRMLGGPREHGYFVSDNRCAIEIPKDTAERSFVRAGLVPPHPLDAWRARRGPEGEMPWKDDPQYAERTTAMLEDLRYAVHDTGISLHEPGSLRVLLIASPEPEYAMIAARYWTLMRQADAMQTSGRERPIAGWTAHGYLRLVMPFRPGTFSGLEKLIPPVEMAELLGVKCAEENAKPKEATNADAARQD